MKVNIVAYFLVLWLIPLAGMAQVDSAAADTLPPPSVTDTLRKATPDTVITAKPDTLESDSVVVLFKVRPWEYHEPILADIAATDSTIRWQVWPDWTYKKNRDPGVISYRMGTMGRTNTQQIDAQEPKYQELYWEDIRLNDPVSGVANWSYIPHHKIDAIYESNLGTVYRTKFYLKDYYLNKPLTQLNYTESSFDTRSLEFVVSHNLSQKTNAEISYWDRRDGGEYDNSDVTGRQIYARITHQLDKRQAVKLRFLNNNYNIGQPFGYIIPSNPANFAFDQYTAQPLESSGSEDRGSTVLALNYYRRPADTTNATSNLHTGLFMNSSSRDVSYSQDTTSYSVRELGVNARKWLQAGPVKLEGGASFSYFLNKTDSTSSLQTSNWSLLNGEAKAVFSPISFLQIDGQGNYRIRSDGYSDQRLGARAKFSIFNRVNLTAGITTGSLMPSPQQLYWQADEFNGNSDLRKEKITELFADLRLEPFRGSELGVKSELKQIDDGIMIEEDSTFTNINPYSALSSTLFMNYESAHFELSGSATVQQFGSFLKKRNTPVPIDNSQHIWFKSSAYVKGYLFNRATYVKAGLSGIISPQAYYTARYYPSLDFWQSAGDSYIPSFNRLDVDLSARVRSIMVLLRYENVLDDVGQLGYFETAGYPMTQRRFIFGIRVLFRN